MKSCETKSCNSEMFRRKVDGGLFILVPYGSHAFAVQNNQPTIRYTACCSGNMILIDPLPTPLAP